MTSAPFSRLFYLPHVNGVGLRLAGSDYHGSGSDYHGSSIFPILLSLAINKLHLRTLSIRVFFFLQELEVKFIYKSNIGVQHGPDFATRTWLLFLARRYLANLAILRQIANVCIRLYFYTDTA